ncbi:MAG: hypothetical protein FJ276_35040, partial [Planctomycetes bacterium]|nr:hypothetical protein [Planctomycetota bacterium]
MEINAFPTASTRRVPAWLLSAALHVALLVACGLLFRSSRPMAAVTEDRPVGIALVEHDAETITYTDASEDREQSPAEPAPAAPDRTWELPDAAAMPLAS